MKKFLSVFAGLCLALVMVVSLAGCGSKEEESSGNDVNLENSDEREKEDGSEDSSSGKLLGGKKTYASVQEYIDAQQDQIDDAIEQNAGSGMTMEITADGDALAEHFLIFL